MHPAVRGWALAVAVYFLAVFHRSSLGVAGLLAERRFGIDAGKLGVFVMLQIGVYAAMQIPTGVLVDRWDKKTVSKSFSITKGSIASNLFDPGYFPQAKTFAAEAFDARFNYNFTSSNKQEIENRWLLGAAARSTLQERFP